MREGLNIYVATIDYFNYHVYFVVIHEYTDTEKEGEEKLVLLKE